MWSYPHRAGRKATSSMLRLWRQLRSSVVNLTRVQDIVDVLQECLLATKLELDRLFVSISM